MFPERLQLAYDLIPAGTDVIVSHQPPYGHCDEPDPRYCIGESGGNHCGSHELAGAIERVQPEIVICGHIHGGHGVSKHGRTRIYNVAIVDEAFRPVNPITVIDV